jgi:hypothetical protein
MADQQRQNAKDDWDPGFKSKKLKGAPGGKYGKKH